MKHAHRFALIAVLLLAAAAPSLAQNVVGTWNGKVDVSGVKPKDDNERKGLAMMKQMITSMKISMTLKGDHTCVLSTTMTKAGKTQQQKGSWTQSGKTVTITDNRGKPQKFTVSSNGRSMVGIPGTGAMAPSGIKFIFTRV